MSGLLPLASELWDRLANPLEREPDQQHADLGPDKLSQHEDDLQFNHFELAAVPMTSSTT